MEKFFTSRSSEESLTESIIVSLKVVAYSLRVPTGRIEIPVPILGEFISSVGLDQIGSNAPHFVYTIQVKVSSPTMQTWEVHKRFSELAALDDSLSAMTKCLPYFPPRGARRDLDDACALERQRLLNEYFEILVKLVPVIHTREFLTFFQFDFARFEKYIPSKVADIIVLPPNTSTEYVSDIALSGTFLSISISSVAPSRYIFWKTRRPTKSSIVVFRKLLNCYLFEKASIYTFSNFNVHLLLFVGENYLCFATSDRRIGLITRCDDARSSPSYVQCGALVTSLAYDGKDTLWAGDQDGVVHTVNLLTKQIELRMNTNCLSSVTAIHICGLIYVGFSNGMISIFNSRVLVTILQGPDSALVRIFLMEALLCCAHSDGTVQFWDVSEVLTSGTRQLPPWGPGGAITDMLPDGEGGLVLSLSNGTVTLIGPNRATKTLFRSSGGKLAVGWGGIFVAGQSKTEVWQTEGSEIFDFLDVSTLELCQSVPKAPCARTVSHPEPTYSDDDLDSWARM